MSSGSTKAVVFRNWSDAFSLRGRGSGSTRCSGSASAMQTVQKALSGKPSESSQSRILQEARGSIIGCHDTCHQTA